MPIAGVAPPTCLRLGHRAIVMQLALICQVGCGTASSAGEGWAYVGSDASLRSPVPILNDNQSQEQRLKLAREGLEAWKRRVSEAVATDKTYCAKETGESSTSSAVFGYGKAFEACMRNRGWQRVSSPL
jgi:hypothetical protein